MGRGESTELERENFQEDVIKHNLRMLNSEMNNLLGEESVGGNAGSVVIDSKPYNCAGANGYANPESGKIITFGNFGDREIKARGIEGVKFILQVAFILNLKEKRGIQRIVNFLGAERFSSNGREAIEQAVRRYNEENELEAGDKVRSEGQR